MSRSGYYGWLKRRPSRRTREDVELSQKIVDIHARSRTTYGSPRIHRSLQHQGVHVGAKRVARLMRENGIKGRVVTVTRRAPKLRRFQQAGANLRLQRGAPTGCDQQWVADITYIKVGPRYQYLVTIMDVYSRRILGWSLRSTRTADDVLPLLRRVILRRSPRPGLIFHTDRGIEFMAYTVQEELAHHGLARSYNRLGYCTDNAHMESFYHSLKGELIRGRQFNDESALRAALSCSSPALVDAF